MGNRSSCWAQVRAGGDFAVKIGRGRRELVVLVLPPGADLSSALELLASPRADPRDRMTALCRAFGARFFAGRRGAAVEGGCVVVGREGGDDALRASHAFVYLDEKDLVRILRDLTGELGDYIAQRHREWSRVVFAVV